MEQDSALDRARWFARIGCHTLPGLSTRRCCLAADPRAATAMTLSQGLLRPLERGEDGGAPPSDPHLRGKPMQV
jgi:hypothetical protein